MTIDFFPFIIGNILFFNYYIFVIFSIVRLFHTGFTQKWYIKFSRLVIDILVAENIVPKWENLCLALKDKIIITFLKNLQLFKDLPFR